MLHLSLSATLLRLSSQLPMTLSPTPPAKRVVVDILETPKKPTQSFVSDASPEAEDDLLKNLKDQAQHLSRVTRRFKEQMIAREKDTTRNFVPNLNPHRTNFMNETQRSTSQSRARSDLQKNNTLTGEGPVRSSYEPPGIDRPMSVTRRVQLSPSTIAEYIPEVREGGFTSLNTDQFIHYTFYARINEQIRNRWIQNLRYFSSAVGPQALSQLSPRKQVTELEVLIDQEGRYHSALIHRRSDHPDLDQAALLAIQNAAPFINPPTEIASEDGFIRLYYSFYIEWRPLHMARPNR